MQLGQQGILLGKLPPGRGFKIGVIGDSNANGASSAITTCSPGTLFNFNGSAFDEITTQSVSNGNPTLGSIWHSFATQYKAAFGRPVYLMNGGKGGSYYLNAANANSWGSSGTLRGDFQTKVTAGLAAINATALDLIIVNLGVNDARNAHAIASIRTSMDDLYTWIESNYPGVPILAVQVGRKESAMSDALLYQVREYTTLMARDHTNVSMCGIGCIWFFLSGYEADNLHFNATGQAGLAANFVRWLQFSSLSKWGRSMLSTMFDTPSSGRITLLNNFISSQVTSGNYFRLVDLNLFQCSSDVRDLLVDASFVGYGAASGATFVANDCLSFDGVDDYYGTAVQPGAYSGTRITQNDFIAGCHVKTNSSAGVVALFGGTDASCSLSLIQNGVRYRANDNTLSAGTDTLIQNNTMYSVRRTGTTKALYKNKTSNASVVQASTNSLNLTVVVGAQQLVGPTFGSFMQVDTRMFFFGASSSFDLDNFYDNWTTLTTNW